MANKQVKELIENGVLVINDGYRAKNSELTRQNGIPFARAGNIDDGFLFDNADLFPEADLENVGNKISHKGDVVFTSKGTVGRFAFVKDNTPKFVYSPQLCFWRSTDSKCIYPKWLYYWMQSDFFYQQYKGVAGQTTMAEYVSLQDQRNMEIDIPDLSKQQGIAHILGALDDKIELLRQMNETLEAMARALFKSWFIDFDPVHKKAEGQPTGLPPEIDALFPDSFEDSELGEIPKGWKVKPLDEIASFLNGIAGQKYPAKGDGTDIPVVKISEVRANDCKGSDLASSDIPTEYIVNDGDILFPWSGSLMVSLWTGGHGLLNQHIFKVTSQIHHKWFVFYWIEHYMEYFQSIASDKATTMGHIQRGHLSTTKCIIPPEEIENWMNKISDPISDLILQNKVEMKQNCILRDFLLPKLISGDLELSDKMISKILEPVK